MTDEEKLHPAVKDFLSKCGKKGGSVKSIKKCLAVAENGKLGGWPKGRPRKKKKE